MFGNEDEGVILGGHDHEGCDVLHKRLPEEEQQLSWAETIWSSRDELKRRQLDAEVAMESTGEETVDHDDPTTEEKEIDPIEVDQFEYHARNNLSHGIWRAEKYSPGTSGIREITVRSMMGDFHGNVGLLTAHFNHSAQGNPPQLPPLTDSQSGNSGMRPVHSSFNIGGG